MAGLAQLSCRKTGVYQKYKSGARVEKEWGSRPGNRKCECPPGVCTLSGFESENPPLVNTHERERMGMYSEVRSTCEQYAGRAEPGSFFGSCFPAQLKSSNAKECIIRPEKRNSEKKQNVLPRKQVNKGMPEGCFRPHFEAKPSSFFEAGRQGDTRARL